MVLNGVVVGAVNADVLDVRVTELPGCGNLLQLAAVLAREELALVVQELEGVPLAWIVGGGDDDAAVGVMMQHGHLRGRGGGEPGVDDIGPHSLEGAAHQAADHIA